MKAAYIAMAFGVALLILSSYVCYEAWDKYQVFKKSAEYYKNKKDYFGFYKLFGSLLESLEIATILIMVMQAEFALIGASIIALACAVRKL